MSKVIGHAVCVIIQNDEGKILGVSRKDDPNMFGLAGGKVDPEDGTDYESAIIRECKEETGLDIYDLVEIDGFMTKSKRIEIIFLEQNNSILNKKFSKNRFYYRDDGSIDQILPLRYYNFLCIIDEDGRDIWLRILKATEITRSDNKNINKLISNAKQIENGN